MSSIKIRTQTIDGGRLELKLLINHPMENGRNRDPISGALIPAHFIQELTLSLNDTVIFTTDMGGSMAKNPYFSLRLRTAQNGDRLSVRWQDNQGFSDTAEALVKLD